MQQSCSERHAYKGAFFFFRFRIVLGDAFEYTSIISHRNLLTSGQILLINHFLSSLCTCHGESLFDRIL